MNSIPSENLLSTHAPLQPVSNCPEILAHQALRFFELWEELEKENKEECIPFWGCIWPGAKSLARYILQNQNMFMGKTILDFGCGCGVVSIAAAKAGAALVVANDIDEAALFVADKNFKANGVNVTISSDNLLETKTLCSSYDYIFVADMFYERSTSEATLTFLLELRDKGAQVIIADGNRPFAPVSISKIICSENFAVDPEVEGVSIRPVRLMILRPDIE